MNNLSPCPFCDPEETKPCLMPEIEVRGDMIFVFIVCKNCYCRGPEINTNYPVDVEGAVKAWNNRPETEAIHAAALKDAAAMLAEYAKNKELKAELNAMRERISDLEDKLSEASQFGRWER